LLESPVRLSLLGRIRVDVHLVFLCSAFVHMGHLLAHIVVLWVVADFDLQDLAVYNVRCLLLYGSNLPCALVAHFYRNVNADEAARVDVLRLQKPCLDRKHVKVP